MVHDIVPCRYMIHGMADWSKSFQALTLTLNYAVLSCVLNGWTVAAYNIQAYIIPAAYSIATSPHQALGTKHQAS
jgi:hypothetical protein